MNATADPHVSATIERLIAQTPGWTPFDELLALHMLAVATAPLGGDILEIGSWCGRSTAVLGHAARRSGGHVHAVDLFPHRDDWRDNPDGSHSFAVTIDGTTYGGYEDQTVWDEPYRRDILPIYARYDSILDAFRATIATENLADRVTPVRGTGALFAATGPRPRCRFAFIDGDHSYEAVCADIEAAETMLAPGGWIAFDDAFSHYEGVDRAIIDRIERSGRYDLGHRIARKLFVARRIA